MKNNINTGLTFFTIFCFIFSILDAESIEKYYDDIRLLNGQSLKKELHKKISNHNMFPYFQSKENPIGVGEMMEFTDQDQNNVENLILFYTGRSQDYDFTDWGNRIDYKKKFNDIHENAWNREHIWPKSHGFPSKKDTAYTDIHHLRPADRSVNGDRGARDYDWGGLANKEAPDTFSDFDSFEPRDEIKGDIARMLFYMAVRYEEDGQYDLEIVDETNTHGPRIGKLSTLLEWHKLDPVSEAERKRNQIIYEKYQGNRNPFIDHPEFVERIWGKPISETTLNIYTSYLKFGDIRTGKKAEMQEYVVQGYHLSNDVSVAVPSGFIAYDNQKKKLESVFTISPQKGFVNELIYIQFAPNKEKIYNTSLEISSKDKKLEVPLFGRGVHPKTEFLLTEDFEAKSTSWEMISVRSNKNWEIGSYGSNYFAKIKGYKSDVPCEDWLISPSIPTAFKNITFQFESAMNYKDEIPGLTVYFTKNYTGDPSTTKWKELPAKISDGHWNWVSSGYLKLDVKKAKSPRVGFLYKNSATNKGRSWEVDNIIISGVPK